MSVLPTTPVRGYVNLFYLVPSARGRGLGQALHDHFVQFMRAGGAVAARLRVSPTNSRAIAYYLKHSWRDLGLRPDDDKVHVMETDLGAAQRRMPTCAGESSFPEGMHPRGDSELTNTRSRRCPLEHSSALSCSATGEPDERCGPAKVPPTAACAGESEFQRSLPRTVGSPSVSLPASNIRALAPFGALPASNIYSSEPVRLVLSARATRSQTACIEGNCLTSFRVTTRRCWTTHHHHPRADTHSSPVTRSQCRSRAQSIAIAKARQRRAQEPTDQHVTLAS
jgi:hypothetical protein